MTSPSGPLGAAGQQRELGNFLEECWVFANPKRLGQQRGSADSGDAAIGGVPRGQIAAPSLPQAPRGRVTQLPDATYASLPRDTSEVPGGEVVITVRPGPPDGCHACGRARWWSISNGQFWTCGACHPPVDVIDATWWDGNEVVP
jgi:hypothetical protein